MQNGPMELSSSQNEQQLAEQIRSGNVQALADYVELKRQPLLAYIQGQIGARLRLKVEPEDILQESAAEAVRVLDQIDLKDREPFSWLCHIAQRRVIDAHRRYFGAQKRDAGREVALGAPGGSSSRPAVIDLIVASMTTVSMAFARNERERELVSALTELPEVQREALRLRYVEGLPSKEIAARLGKTDGAIRVMLTRSINRLQAILAQQSEEG